MNLNQSAHGDREFGFIDTRLRAPRKIVVGHWQDPDGAGPHRRLDARRRGWHEAQHAARSPASATTCARSPSPRATRSRPRCASASRSTATASAIWSARSTAVDRRRGRPPLRRVRGAATRCRRSCAGRRAARVAARRRAHRARPARLPRGGRLRGRSPTRSRISHGLRAAARPRRPAPDGRRLRLRRRGRLEDRALVRAMKVMGAGLQGGTSFMEDYTYHLGAGRPAGPRRAHARGLPVDRRRQARRCEIHPLGIGGREDPVRLVFTRRAGPALMRRSSTWATASAWSSTRSTSSSRRQAAEAARGPRRVGAAARLRHRGRGWLLAGGPHHTGFSQARRPSKCSRTSPPSPASSS